MSQSELVFIDLSSIAHPIWHMCQAEPDPNCASQRIVARVRALASQHPHVAICRDSGRSFRKDVAASYKANRPESDAPLQHQITLACELLEADGFPIWSAKGFEADDLIATGVRLARQADHEALIVSADKDLLQLVGERVRAMNAKDGAVLDADGVIAKFGVAPHQMRDYLMLVGDTSDNVKGAKGIGPKKAADLLQRFGSLDNIYTVIDANAGQASAGIPTMVEMSLKEFRDTSMKTTRELITLRTDVELPFTAILAERVAKAAATFGDFEVEDDMTTTNEQATPADASTDAVTPEAAAPRSAPVDAASSAPNGGESGTGLAVRDAEILPAPKEWERGLDPRSMKDARILAKDMFESRMFSSYGTPQAVLSTVMVGRELGLPALASLRCIHVIEGKHGLSASLMVALVLRAGLAEFFEPISFSDKEATYETKRKNGRNAIRLTHTIEMAVQAWPKSKGDWQKAFEASGWGRNPTDMLVARASARLARMVYPDLLAGLYTPEELAEIRESLAA
jgi:5'-3' exonuclease